MNLELDDDLRMLGESLSGWLGQHLPFERRATLRAPAAQLAFWRELDGALTLAGAGLPESWGGFGAGMSAHMVVMEALGAALASTPYVESAVIAGTLLERLAPQGPLGPQIASGEKLVIPAWDEVQGRGDPLSLRTTASEGADGWRITGAKCAVRWGGQADVLLVSAITAQGPGVFVVDPSASGVAGREVRLIDDHPALELTLSDAPGTPLAVGEAAGAALVAAIDAGTAAVCAEGVGLMRTLLDDTIDYTKQRKQFGQTLVSFQALQHRMVDMRMLIEQSAAAVLLAVLKVDQPAAVSTAKTTVGEAVRKVGQEAVQLHGAMGLTEELRVGHYFRRATAIENQFGDADRHLARYRDLTLA
ncbi:acyl-CoA dehydrogenase family protein [Novosphingobium sp.]|uniref:acyl-CoA dehydrogenase family protein n=1 Tax=Novosphingobium sp. TaxID=1874826 RepID=UPI0035ADDC6C